MSRITLVLGGTRSGKSRFAEGLGAKHKGTKHYIATAEAFDEEMKARIAAHQWRRGAGWGTREAPLDLVEVLAECGKDFVLIDCITIWLGNLMHHGRDVAKAIADLCQALRRSDARIVLVSNEVGLGIVPDNAMARSFRDAQGIANQHLAELANEVIFVVAGLPLVLKKPRRRPASGRTAK